MLNEKEEYSEKEKHKIMDDLKDKRLKFSYKTLMNYFKILNIFEDEKINTKKSLE